MAPQSDPQVTGLPAYSTPGAVSEGAVHGFMRQVFLWMFLALGITTAVAAYVASTSNISDYINTHPQFMWVLFAAQIGLVLGLSFLFNKISASVATFLFIVYAGLTGVVFSVLLEVYSTGSIVGAFAGATGVFAGMALYGVFTKRDLTGLAPVLFGALMGFFVASIAFVFIGGSTFNLILGWAGVLIFSLLTAYDMQKIKQIGESGLEQGEQAQKLAIFGALALYLDFINLFISLLRIFGRN